MSFVCDDEVRDLLLKRAIFSVPEPSDEFVRNMFAIKKRSSGSKEQFYRQKTNFNV